MALFNELQQLMVEHRFRPNRKMAQHFVVDEKLLDRIVAEAGLKKTDTVLEIGPGTGFLTERLLRHSKVLAVELSSELSDILEKRFAKNRGFTLVRGNFLGERLPRFNKVVSLPPYHLSSNIMNRLFAEKFDVAILVFQREFCSKLMAEPGFREYSYLSVLTDYLFHRTMLISNIASASFYPRPESYSSLIKLVRRKNIDETIDFAKFSVFVKQLFRYKNKNTANALDNCLGETKRIFGIKREKARKIASELDIGDIKVNLLETRDVVGLFRSISGG